MAPGACSACARTFIRPPKCRWRTTSPRRWWCRRSGSSTLNPDYTNPSVKFVQNCEDALFQRPDEAVHRGYDKQAEQDLSEPGNFLSNLSR